MKSGNRVTARIAVDGLFTALALIMFMIESLFPSIPFAPGAKMGLANAFSMAALILYGPLDAAAVVVCRCLLGAVFTNFSAVLYSLSGGLASLALSILFLYVIYPKVSVMATSIAAAVTHNIVQLFVFAAVASSTDIFAYLPYFALLGVIAGAIVGGVVMLIFRQVPLSVYERALGIKTRKSTAEIAEE